MYQPRRDLLRMKSSSFSHRCRLAETLINVQPNVTSTPGGGNDFCRRQQSYTSVLKTISSASIRMNNAAAVKIIRRKSWRI